MEDLKIILPCGYSTEYKHLKTNSVTIECPICQTHYVDVEQCLNMPKNQFNIKKKLIDIEYKNVLEYKLICDSITADPNYFIDQNFSEIIQVIDLKRENIKLNLKKDIDQYYNKLIDKLDLNKQLKLEYFEENRKIIDIFFKYLNLDEIEANDTEIDIKEKIKSIETYLDDIKKIEIVLEKTINDEKENFLFFNLNKSITDGRELFGQIEFGPNLNYKNVFNFQFNRIDDNVLNRLVTQVNGCGFDFFDNETLLCGFSDNSINLFSLENGNCLKVFTGHLLKTLCIIAINKELFASSSADGTIRIWNEKTGQCLRVLTGHKEYVKRIKLLPNDQLMSLSYDSTIKIWNYESGKCLKTFSLNCEETITCLEIIDNDTYITCGEDKKIKLWNLITGSHIKEIITKKSVYSSLILNHDLIAIGAKESIDIWNLKTSECCKTLYGHNDSIIVLRKLKNNDILVSGSTDGNIKFWNLETYECMKTLKTDLLYNLLISKDDNILYTLEAKNVIRVWKIDNI